MNELAISLNIADRPYKLVVEKDHEELFRKATRLIEKRIKDYSVNYAYKDKQDLLAMVALEYATSFLQAEELLKQQEGQWETKLNEVDRVLAEYLSEQNVL
ncbi:MAG: cell division protein ZapA [Bacteroidetes bacterium]|nr:cell division protein ZapA [Bacteroidota bacterium]